MQALPNPQDCCETCEESAATTTIPGPQGEAGADGANGNDGENAFTTLGAAYTMPARGAASNATVDDSSWCAYGQIVVLGNPTLPGYAHMRVTAIVDGTTVTLFNLDDNVDAYTDNVPPATVLPIGTRVSPAGMQGPAGADGVSGAPDDATYLLVSANPSLASATVLNGMGTGVVLFNDATNTVTVGDADLTTDVTGVLPLANGGTGGATQAAARAGIGAAKSGANTDITALTGLTTPLGLAYGGTGGTDAATARANIIPTPLSVAQGGTAGATAAAARAGLEVETATTDVILLEHTVASGNNGGDFNNAAWRTRTINAETIDTGGHCSILANRFTLAAGSYRCRISAVAYKVDKHQIRLYDVTAGAAVAYGLVCCSSNAGTEQVPSTLDYRFTIAVPTVYEVQHYCETTQAASGMGLAASFGTSEVYLQAWLEREAG